MRLILFKAPRDFFPKLSPNMRVDARELLEFLRWYSNDITVD